MGSSFVKSFMRLTPKFNSSIVTSFMRNFKGGKKVDLTQPIKTPQSQNINKRVSSGKPITPTTKTSDVLTDPIFKSRKRVEQIISKIPTKQQSLINAEAAMSETAILNDENFKKVGIVDESGSVIDHSSGVYKTLSNGIAYFFKPKKEEASMSNDGTACKKGIKNDNLGLREVLAYGVSKALGMDIVPPVKIIPTRNGDHGTMQMGLQNFVKGFRDKDIPTKFKDTKDMDLMDRDKFAKGNGVDLAVLDFINGNTDRSSFNEMGGVDNTGKHTMYGIDNGLAFPAHPENVLTPDYHQSLQGNWGRCIKKGADAFMGDALMQSLVNPHNIKNTHILLDNSGLEPEAIKAAKYRLDYTSMYIKSKMSKAGTRNVKITGDDFGKIIKHFIDNYRSQSLTDANSRGISSGMFLKGADEIFNPHKKEIL